MTRLEIFKQLAEFKTRNGISKPGPISIDQFSNERTGGAATMKIPVVISILELPPTANELRRKYRSPHAYKELRDHWREMIAWSIPADDSSALRELAKNKHKMQVVIHLMVQELRDKDGLYACVKPLLDSMTPTVLTKNGKRVIRTGLGILAGDRPDQIELTVNQSKGRWNATAIVLLPIL